MKITKPILSGTCVYSEKDAAELVRCGASAISLGTIFLLAGFGFPRLMRFLLER